MPTLSQIIGQPKATSQLRRSLAGGKVAHAFLFSGPEGVGKLTTARALAAALNCTEAPNEGCGRCSACERIDAGLHPDLIELHPDGKFIKVETVRELARRLVLHPHEARCRVVIVDRAETLHPSAANAMLKAVEEPRPGTLFVLITAARQRVVPTLTSRCQRVQFAPLAREEVQRVLEALQHQQRERPEQGALEDADEAIATASPAELEAAAGAAEGSPGRALLLLDQQQLGEWQQIARRLREQARQSSAADLFRAVADCGRDRATLLRAVDLLRFELRDELLAALGRGRGAHRQASVEPAARPARIIGQLRAVQQAEDALQRNVNPALALETLVLQMRAGRSH